jgi:hypothetical protein
VIRPSKLNYQIAASLEDWPMILENDFYLVDIEETNGTITRILDKIGKCELITEPRLADNFRLLLPTPKTQANYVIGSAKKLTSLERTANGLSLTWQGPLASETGESLDLAVTMRVELVGEAIRFDLEVDNRTPYQLAEVWCPIIGGVNGIGNRQDTQEMIPSAGASTGTNLFKQFVPACELGSPYPELAYGYPAVMSMPWADIYNTKTGRGMYIGCHDDICRYKVLRFELQPGLGHRECGSWPLPGEAGELPIGMTINWAQFPYSAPGEKYQAPPVILQFHDGDWHQGSRIYRKWFDSKFPLVSTEGDWLHDQPAFYDVMLLLPEGNVLWKFSDIPQLTRDALAYDVKSILISGWDMGGHDSDYPNYQPDPRLGTWDDLAEAIRRVHELGAKVYFFVNVQPVDPDTDWYRDELHKYRGMDPWGASVYYGFGMGTLGARLGHTKRPLVSVSPSFPEYRRIITDRMVKLAEIGADGLHVDKLWPFVALDFNPNLPVSPDRATSEGMLKSVAETNEACRVINPDFRLSIETAWDRVLEFSDVGWAWHATATDHVPMLKYTFPQWEPTIAVCQPFDYTPVNHAMRYGYQIFVGPGHWTESMAHEPFKPLAGYIKEIIRLREQLKDSIYHAEFMDTLDVKFDAPPHVRYSSFRNYKTGKRACVVVNYGADASEAEVIAFDGNTEGQVKVYLLYEEPRTQTLPLRVTIPAQRLAVVVEK